jgi:acyl carrier protein
MSTIEALRQLMNQEFGLDAAAIEADTSFPDLGMDSLTMVDFIFKVEDAFGVSIDFDAAQQEPTLAGFARLIDTLRAAAPQPVPA